LDGVGIEGWVKGGDDWRHVSIGNERLLKSNGGRARPSKQAMKEVDKFLIKCSGMMILYITVDDKLEKIIALAGTLDLKASYYILYTILY
jgi:hypothetical protein